MSDPRPAHVIGPPGSLRDRVAAAVGPTPRVTDVGTFLSSLDAPEPPAPGVVLLLADELDAADTLQALEALARGDGDWTPCLVRERAGEIGVRTVSLGWLHGLGDVDAFRRGDEDLLLELRRALKRMSRSRHDINNPLTSGMAETQLLLMDVEDEVTRGALETIQNQLRRIRDLVAATGGLRTGTD